jgi:hypothetical protein
MGTRRDGRIDAGQKLSKAISARAWNRAQDAADVVLGQAPGVDAADAGGFNRLPNFVMVKNTTGQVVPRLGVLGIGSVEIDPSGGTLDGTDAASVRAREFARRPVLRGVTPASPEHLERFVVLLEPASANEVVRGAIGGSFACLVNVIDTTHRFATIKAGDREQLESTECGVLQLLWKESGTGLKKWAVGVM